MLTDPDIRKRLKWIRLYEESGNAGVVCLKCGISRPTLRKWWLRYLELGVSGLQSQSRCPKLSPKRKIFDEQETLILEMRRKRKLGNRRIQSELFRLHSFRISTTVIHRTLKRNGLSSIKIKRSYRKHTRRYNRPIPGDRVQLDVCKIAPGLYQYTMVDDCYGYRVLGLYPRRTALNSVKFFDKVIDECPFTIQRVQTDRGREFFGYKFQDYLIKMGIRFRPIKPGSPHLNGKVERSQRTDLDEFYATVDLQAPYLDEQLQLWQYYYNWDRQHTSLQGKTPIAMVIKLADKTPLWEEVSSLYDPRKERMQIQNYKADLAVAKLKRCM